MATDFFEKRRDGTAETAELGQETDERECRLCTLTTDEIKLVAEAGK